MRHKISFLLLAAALGYGQKHTEAERSLPSFFIPNRGLTDAAVQYFVETPELRAGFRADSAIFQLHDLSLNVRFAGANPQVQVEAEEELAARANFLIGDRPEQWQTGVPLYQKILYRDLYPGIDMTYGGTGHRIKSEFLVWPGADPQRIRLEYSSASNVGMQIEENGALVIRGDKMEVREEAPAVYQIAASGRRVEITASYRLVDAHTLGFELGAYDTSLPLVIDPVLTYATYLGGTGMSAVTALALDSSGDLYVAGWTEALDFHIVGPEQGSNLGGVDAFVAKLNAAGTAFLYATYMGGRGDDRAMGIAVDSLGEAFVVGSTASTNFPLISPISSTLGGGKDGFVFKLNSVGNTLLYSTYLGGTSTDIANAIALDASGNAYVAGDTSSADFPTRSGGVQTFFGGQTDAFVSKLNSSGALVQSTFLGGSGVEHAAALALDASNNIYVAGGTTSTNYPVLGAIQSTNHGNQDAFLTKLNSAGSQIVYSTYLGGTGGGAGTPEQANAVAVDSGGNAYIAGATNSSNFPTTAGAFQGAFNGTMEAFIAKVNPAGNGLLYSTYFGGSAFNWINGLVLDASGNAYLAGYTGSADLPQSSAMQAFGGMYDAFVARLNAQGNGIGFSTFYGGSGSDSANAIAVDTSGNIFVGGQTGSVNLPLQVPIQSSNAGGSVGWVARFGVTPPPGQVPSAVSVSPGSGSGNTVIFTATYSHPAGANAILAATLLLNTSASPNYACQVTYTTSANLFALANDVVTSGSASVVPRSSTTATNDQCTLNGAGTFATLSGTTMTLTVSLTFQAAFPGAKTIYLSANDVNTNTGLVAKGTWTVTIPPTPPSVISATPASGVGVFPTYLVTVSDPVAASNLSSVAVLISSGSAANTSSSCYVVYNRTLGTVSLYADDGVSLSLSKPLGSSATMQNSQCAVGFTGQSASGNTLQFTLQVLYNSKFYGPKNVFVLAADANGLNSGFVNTGTWTAANAVPTAVSASPNSGVGVFPTYVMTVSDPSSSANITTVGVLVTAGSSTSVSNACYVVFNRTANTVSLYGDDGVNLFSKTLGSSSTLANSQCSVGFTSATTSGNSLLFTVQLLYNSAFFGTKNIFLLGSESGGVSSGWTNVGTWTAAFGIPTAVSASPSSGVGVFPTYVMTVSDPTSSTNITNIATLVTAGAVTNTANACYVVYNRGNSTVSLYGDDGQSQSSKPLGSSNTLQNSQCAVGFTAIAASGNTLQFTLQLQYKSVFFGLKNIYLLGSDSGTVSSGWVNVGTWTAANGVPTAVSMSPSSGAGIFPTYLFTVSDPSAAANITSIGVLVTTGASTNIASSCYVIYNRTNGTVGLYGDDGISFSSKPLGSSSTMQNSQCAIGFAGATVSGNSVQFTLQILYNNNFTTPKNVYLSGSETFSSSGWVAIGTWTP